MATIRGELRAGEAVATGGIIGARQRGSAIWFYVLIIGLMLGGALIVDLLATGVNWISHSNVLDPAAVSGLGLAAGWLAYMLFCKRWLVARFRNRMTSRGLALNYPVILNVQSDRLEYDCGAVKKISDWNSVSELFRAKEYWIFLVQMEPWFAPRRFFNDESDEKAFLREALLHMSEEARVRSTEAVKFAA